MLNQKCVERRLVWYVRIYGVLTSVGTTIGTHVLYIYTAEFLSFLFLHNMSVCASEYNIRELH